MKNIVTVIAEEFINNLVKMLTAKGKSFSELEKQALAESKRTSAKLISAYAETLDAAIVADKTGRREIGYTVQRREDERRLQTLVGEVTFKRTYYKKASGGYEYLTDIMLGIEQRDRVSGGLGLALAEAAKDMSYEKSSEYVNSDKISRQTVMERVRRSSVSEQELPEKRQVPELHIDADEAHVTLYHGKSSEVPLISIYEGIESNRKRHNCKNVFHISEYGKNPDDLWEQALTEIERRYDLSGTKIYLHGDGGGWIQTGFKWIPDAIFVLDKYHKNKAINLMTAGLAQKARKSYEREIRKALRAEELKYVDEIAQNLCVQFPEREGKILPAARYLKRFVKGISICNTDPGANNGGCTEPHVSHILAGRLSSRPMAWSVKTLKRLAPILANGQITLDVKSESEPLPVSKALRKTVAKAGRAFCMGTMGLPHPDSIGRLPVNGKITGTQKLLHLFAK